MSTILIVDDDASIRAVVAEVLTLEGWSTRTAGDGSEALLALDDDLPAAVLLDMHMPVLDGYGFAEELRRRQITVPIIVMTAGTHAAHCAAAINAHSYVNKPFNLDALLDAVSQAVPRA
jgi:two-component system response regulator MprA